MGLQIIKTPGGKYEIFSTNCDGFYFEEALTREQVVRYFKEEAANKAEADTLDLLAKIDKGEGPSGGLWHDLDTAQRLHYRNFGRCRK